MRSNPYLQLIRPANLITSATDIIAGATIATLFVSSSPAENAPIGIILLILASMLLYGGGIAFNDVLDHKLDRIERPERPIPRGSISVKKAAIFAGILMGLGITLAFYHHLTSGMIAFSIALLSLVYNQWSKKHSFAGPLNMGVLRGLNLLLGLSFIPNIFFLHFEIAIIPVVYIFAITMVSRGEVHGSSRKPLLLALFLFLLSDIGILFFASNYGNIWFPLLFTIIHLIYILPPLFKAIREPTSGHIRQTVMHGILGIILLDGIWVSMTEYWLFAFILLLLLPFSQKLGRYFSVT